MPQPDRETLLKNSLDAAVREGGSLVQRAMAEAVRSLAQASVAAGSGGERARFADASEALRRNADALAQRFPDLLREEMGAAATGGRGGKALSFDSLELMGEDQVDDTVELVRGQHAVLAVVEPDLVQLNAIVSGLQGHEVVQAASNPLRPELWVKALHRMLGRGGVPAAMRALWMQHLCPAFAPQLAALYRRLTQDMLVQGVGAASYGVSAPRHESRRRDDAAQFTLHDLKRLLVKASQDHGDTQGLSRPAGDTINGMTVPAAMEALKGMNHMDDVVRRMQERWRSGVWHAERAAEGSGAGSVEYTPTQTLAREVVHRMVENIASDERLLPDIQHLVRGLEPALLQLVLRDQRFFTDRRHPARALLEEITQRSLAWSRQNTTGFADFFGPLQETVQMLARITVQDAEPFEFALLTLRQSWAEAEERVRKRRATVARALIKAESRNQAAASIAAWLRERPDVASAPPEVRRFLLGPWSQVIAAAKLSAPAEKDPGGYDALINDMVWSSQPRLASQNPAKLQRIAAPLLEQLRSGLATIGAPRTDVEPILASLADAHAKALRGETGEAVRAPAKEDAQHIEWQADALPWLTPDEVQDSNLMQATDFAPTTREEPSAWGREHAQQLAVGQYLEVRVRGTWARWKLAWASPQGTMLMFTDAGGRPESVTLQALGRMMESGEARVLPGGSVVDSALDAVAQAALENSSQKAGRP